MANGNGRAPLGECLVAEGRNKYSQAEPILLHSFQVLSAAHGPGDARTRQILEIIVRLYEDWGKPADAAKFRQRMFKTGTDSQVSSRDLSWVPVALRIAIADLLEEHLSGKGNGDCNCVFNTHVGCD